MRKSAVPLFIVTLLALSACAPAVAEPIATEVSATEAPIILPSMLQTPTPVPYLFGMVLPGASNDGGWSQSHFKAGLFVEAKLGVKMLYMERVNPDDNPAMTPAQAAESLAAQGAKLVIFTASEMQASGLEFAQTHPETYVILVGSDLPWSDGRNYVELPNTSALMGRMEFGQMLAGCAAGMTTQTGQIGYIGPAVTDESRRLAASAYLGARHCWSNYRGQDPLALKFKVAWEQTSAGKFDPGQLAVDMYAGGYDVVISGTDSSPILAAAKQYRAGGQNAWASAYNSIQNCEQNAEVCLGAPYFNWGPGYVAVIKTALDGNWQSVFRWNGPDWADINESETSAVGFVKSTALPPDTLSVIDQFTMDLASGLSSWTGPLNLQDGTPYLAAGEVISDSRVWYLPQLLEGMDGASLP